ncbi:phosphatase PAP2 family protein [Brachyspira aalborgi]|jgi:undecaprenyl-diphosphatase|uniref:Phosphatase PAP2 family protein n=1 Tax=Brachyspira aalborgi TaxID=29522 RepID=A0AB38PYI1_9SPIR|nr:phosphatase PAP2 family protein [Brachyspira aalborgi]CCY76164.1 phosphoesterase PA-phosphatase related protein [Brachyspira sp. CAG:700]TXJ14098.1 phosphatase PAP2 family protein [Brachyspira aalborgi]TXJ18795.1 phosphatase PAP2 family protein [Brachyspira aalborgi]TXJ25557.1 phosphatase PAP2 family protein [Brachyspira aalborgi]TXJ32491.1 phosphatase PAP2 family protein [Brachyspira aalborgi]
MIENIKKRRKRIKKLLKRKRRQKRMNYINNLSIIKFMSQIDDKLFLKIFKDNRRGYFKSFMKLMSRLGDGYVWAFLYFSLYMFRIKYAILYFARAAAAVFICIFVFLYIKSFFSRMRPYKKHDKIPIMYPPDKHSFPSGHTMVGFAISFSVGSYSFGSAILFYTIASLIAFSRVYVGLHYPLDVICGIVLGSVIGMLTNMAFYYIIGLPIVGHI